MNWNDAQALQFALTIFDKKAKSAHDLVWKSKLGIATFETYYVYQGVPVIKREIGIEMVNDLKSNLAVKDNLFGLIRHQVLSNFHFGDDNLISNSFFDDVPELLLGKLSALVSNLDLESTQIAKPDTDTVWNYRSLDGGISLPFISTDVLGEVTPVSLVSKNLPDTE
ncbi:hypothetical protein FC50_GL002358 [Lacticaseibacillus pantheris DSM 15945 = JCM 12539 = NBRC 106106]|uniref:Uncharacterized protein n=1 Tax=Lacticaseibacillus pantheris DSM 15945 = JCM 12539 = NBRC 106106 TaxID=1423783 RepID=A0A0R1U5W7_9LACO|nr:hypothetical protein [Lacticaseibacillus pantheris]KRL88599.1 hypothetical protein FC50_GL002358 [Lacticaseibacillus pantheris DSM 15945 = JCM 12539 = NBRC 106106]